MLLNCNENVMHDNFNQNIPCFSDGNAVGKIWSFQRWYQLTKKPATDSLKFFSACEGISYIHSHSRIRNMKYAVSVYYRINMLLAERGQNLWPDGSSGW
jgi:hypothetical protein